ncbi:hypothetical protein HYR99_41455 [Candidatus Poribacteria bacterium]|nr:hypothetical protein [Candidatus Poribacteria bacterium]
MGRVSQLEDIEERRPDKPTFTVGNTSLIQCPVCENTFLSNKELQQHITVSHAQDHAYILVNKQVIRDFDYVEDRIDSIEAISLGPNEVKLQICVNGANVKNTTFSEKISLLPYLKKFTCGEVNISIGSQRYIIYLKDYPNFNSEVIDRAVFDYLFLPLNERKEPKWDCFNPFISSDRSELERRYASGLYEYALAFHMMQEKKEAKDHFENAFSLLSPFANTKNFAIWARCVLALRMNAFGVLKNCQFPSRFAVANYFFNDSESRFNCNDRFLINRNPVVEYGVYIDDCSETFLDALSAYYNEDYFMLDALCQRLELLISENDRNNWDKLHLLYARTAVKKGNFTDARIFYQMLYSHPTFKKEAKEMLNVT